MVERLIRSGHTEVVDADLSGYFDSIPHAELMKSVSRRISDGRVLRLIKMWLEVPVEETDGKGNRHRTTRNKDQGIGTPQGSPISPLLANVYMRRFVKGWKTGGHEDRLEARIVNYADDFVICCRGTAEEAMTKMRTMMSKLKLTVNEQKTRLCRLPEETFDFLGYTLGRNYDCRTGESYLGPRPSRKKVDRICDAIGKLTTTRKTWLDVEELVGRINRKLRGWSGYFRIGTVSKAYRKIDSHTRHRVRQWLCAKFKVPRSREVSLHRLLPAPGAGSSPASGNEATTVRGRTCVKCHLPSLVRKPGAGNPPARFDERGVETGHGQASEAPADERAGN